MEKSYFLPTQTMHKNEENLSHEAHPSLETAFKETGQSFFNVAYSTMKYNDMNSQLIVIS